MVSPFHQVKNAKSAMESVANADCVHVEKREEEMGHAEFEFRFSDDASFSMVRGLCESLTERGWDENTDESEFQGTLSFTWDKKVLNE